MAKLSGVTVLPAVAERIQYEGKTYVRAAKDAAPKAGDIIRADRSGWCDITPGAFYPVEIGEDGWYFADDDGDKRDFDGEYGLEVDAEDFTGFTPESAATADSDTFVACAKPPQPERLKVGDYAKVVNQPSHHQNDTIVKIVGLNWCGSGKYDTQDLDGGEGDIHGDSELERVTDDEVAEAKRNTEETAKWARIGRKPGEFRNGDVIRFTTYTGACKAGTYATIEDLRQDMFTFEYNGSKFGGSTGWCELVAPAESVFNANAGN